MKIKFLKADNGDSILLSFDDSLGISRNILVDGGMPKTYFGSGVYGDLYYTIEEIKSKGQNIDLLILTHIDSDHIGGLKKWFEEDKEAFKYIKKVWFNSGKSISKYFGEVENPDLIEKLEIFNTTQTSINEAIDFEDYIESHNIWDKELIKKGIEVNQNGVEIKLLSPNDKSLKRLLKEYKKPEYNYQTSSASNDWNSSIEEFQKEEAKPIYKLEQDHSLTNGSSIAFMLSYKGESFLFLGDANAKLIIESLSELGYTRVNPLIVTFIKVSHHGSSYNTNSDLLKLIKTDNYIISSNNEIHGLPNKRTLSRIIKHNPNAVFYFNYDYVKDNIFKADDFNVYKKFSIKSIVEWM